MSQIAEALLALLKNGSPPAVACPVYAGQAPQGVRAPYVVYQQIGRDGWDHLGGASGMAQRTFQIDSYAAGYSAAHALAKAIRLRFNGFSGDVEIGNASPAVVVRRVSARLTNEFDAFEDQTDPKLDRVLQEFLVTFDEG